MAVLQLEPTAAPDFRGTSKILEQAGLSMSRGFEAARGLLGSYQEGRTERADNEVFAEISKLKTQEQIDAYFDGDGIAGRPISKAARERLGSMRSNLANLNTVQQQTAASIASQARQNAVEGRQATDFETREDQRLAIQGAGSQLLAAQRASSGESVVPGDPLAAAGNLPQAPAAAPVAPISAEAGAVETGFMSQVGAGFTGADGTVYEGVKNPNALAVIAAYGKHESAFDPKNVNREWADGKNNAGGTMSWNGKRLKAMQDFVGDDKSPAAQARFLLQEDPQLMKDLEASTSIEEANAIMAKAWRFKGYQKTGPGSEYADRLATAKGIATATPAATAGSPPPQAQAPGSAGAQLQQAAGAGGFDKDGFVIPSTTADIGNGPTSEGTALLDNMVAAGVHPATVEAMRDELKANREGVRTTKTAADHKTNQANLATVRLEIAADPEFTTAKEGNAEFLRRTKKFSAVDRQEFAATENNLSDVMSILVPDVEEKRNIGVYNAIRNEVRIGEDQLNSMVQHRILNNAIEFGSSDPVGPLIEKLRIGNDGETHPLWGLFGPNADDNVLRKAISQLAQSIEPPVTDGVAAAAMFDIFERDPWGTNTVGNRFNFARAKTFIQTNLNAAAVQTYREERTRIEDRAGELNKAQLTLTDLRRQKVKTKDKGKKSTLTAQIKQLELILEGGQTPREYAQAKSAAAETGAANRALANVAAQPVDFGPDIDPGSVGVQQLPPASLSLTSPPVARPASQFLQLGLGS